jgi:hypothetical protein
MENKKPLSDKTKKLSSKVKNSTKAIERKLSTPKKLSKEKVSPRPAKPELSVVNVIEQISQILRKEVRDLTRKKAAGE